MCVYLVIRSGRGTLYIAVTEWVGTNESVWHSCAAASCPDQLENKKRSNGGMSHPSADGSMVLMLWAWFSKRRLGNA